MSIVIQQATWGDENAATDIKKSMQDSLVEYGARRVIITITAILCALLEIVDTTIVNVALN